MFGMGAGEILILLIVGIVVVGPQKLPGMMRTAGQWVSRLRRMSTDLRAQSGIDRIIRDEGLEKELRELRSLSRAGVLDSLMQASAATRAPLAPLARPVRQPIGAAGLAAGSPPPEQPRTLAAGTPAEQSVQSLEAQGSSATSPASAGSSSAEPPASDASASGPGSAPSVPSVVVRPAEGRVARHEVREPYLSFREREYPTSGCDHYDAMPDDLDETEGSEAETLGDAPAALGSESAEPAGSEPGPAAAAATAAPTAADPSTPPSTETARPEA